MFVRESLTVKEYTCSTRIGGDYVPPDPAFRGLSYLQITIIVSFNGMDSLLTAGKIRGPCKIWD
jgi:hypothetical protein